MTVGGAGCALDGATNLHRDHSWPKAVFLALGIALSVCIDILQYSMPLSFIPSRLEDAGYSNLQIAAAVGIYYWTGFAVTFVIATYHVYCVLTEDRSKRPEGDDVKRVKIHILYALTALSGGTVTLFVEGLWPIYKVHLCCRFVQGGCGGVIFIFTFLTACSLFKGNQQVLSLTMCSVMFNVAEVLGPYCGALVHDFLGLSAVFYVLGTLSLLCQMWFLAILFSIRENGEATGHEDAFSSTGLVEPTTSHEIGWRRLRSLITSRRFLVSVLLISTAAMIKGGVEECLPFHADHEWKKTPMQIGEFFSVIAGFYLAAAAIVGQLWSLSSQWEVLRVNLSAMMLGCLGFITWALFSVKSFGGGSSALWIALSAYGFGLGVTFTPATLLLGDAVENEEPGAAKDAVNSMWNTMWEAGGSLGFLIGGIFASTYARQVRLFTVFAGVAIVVMALVIAIMIVPSMQTYALKCIRDLSKSPAQKDPRSAPGRRKQESGNPLV